MTLLTRRTMLGNAFAASAGLALAPAIVGCKPRTAQLTLRLRQSPPIPIPANFIGLGYEMSSVAPLGLLSTSNRRYVNLIKGLGPQGVLRVGGIVANYTRYEPEGTIKAQPQDTIITRASLEQFGGFLRETGWSAIWSVNFAQGSLEDAVAEARAVASVLGPHLLAIELGNEVEFYNRGQRPFRKPSYDYSAYRTEYNAWHAAMVKAVPGLRFAAPDTAASVGWVERMAGDANGDVQLLTTHYYRNNQREGSADQLMRPDPRLADVLARLRIAAQQLGIPWRMCETNSFSGGGLPGVSDTFLGALWTLETMLLLALNGCSGVNIETGVNQLGFISSYSPITDDGKGANAAGAPYYGMLAFASAMRGRDQVLPIDFDSTEPNVTAYALGTNGKPGAVAVVNRDRSQTAQVSLAQLGIDRWLLMRLLAPSPQSQTSVTFAGASVDLEGTWKAVSQEPVAEPAATIPPMSAAVLLAAS